MAQRIKWDIYETALLLDGYLRIQSGEKRKDIISEISVKLRFLGEKRGYFIDDIFRNKNGISMQMGVMENCFTNGNSGYKSSNPPWVFRYVVNMYRSNHSAYERLLASAKYMIDQSDFIEKD
ncbi:MAG: hypothetical protein SOV71_05090 [Anaerovoracaceae bacterium]|nr:hypothetical protein [Bacillota bacterium]MDY2670913.1 hypothetical protein [Anaerovoracaceae bacterium]